MTQRKFYSNFALLSYQLHSFFFNSILIQFQIQLASDPWLHFLSLAPNLICCMTFELRCFDILKLPETLAEYSTGVISALLFLMQIFWICITHVPCSHNSRFFGLTLNLLTNGKSFINLICFFQVYMTILNHFVHVQSQRNTFVSLSSVSCSLSSYNYISFMRSRISPFHHSIFNISGMSESKYSLHNLRILESSL